MILALFVSLLLQQPATPVEATRLRIRIQHQGEDQTGRLIAAELQGVFSRAPAYLLIGDDKQASDVTVGLMTLATGPQDTEARSSAVALVMYTTENQTYLHSQLGVIGKNAISLGSQRLSVSIEQVLKKFDLVK